MDEQMQERETTMELKSSLVFALGHDNSVLLQSIGKTQKEKYDNRIGNLDHLVEDLMSGDPTQTIVQSGPDGLLKSQLLNLIDSAESIVCLCSFIIADTEVERALIKAVDRGVRVYALCVCVCVCVLKRSSSSGGDEDEDGDGEWTREDRIREGHKRMLGSFTGRIMLRSSGHFHAKYVIVDGNRCMLTTCNFTTKAMMEKS